MTDEITGSGADPSWEVQTAIYSRLKAATVEGGLLEGVKIVDNMELAEFKDSLPFILIGDDVLTDNENQITDDYTLKTYIRCHAEGTSRKAAKLLAHKVRRLMRAQFTIEGFLEPVAYHSGTQAALVEGVAHEAIVEWTFDLLEDEA